MSKMRETSFVKKQYETNKGLLFRMEFNDKYKTNQQSFADWVFEHYYFFEGCNILELGCGTGAIWENKIQHLPVDSSLILSDFSTAMVEGVKQKYADFENVSTEQVDIQEIPYPDNSFDIVIANSMLYHVPNLQKAISEVYRVLKSGGRFYTTTTGINGMGEYLHNVLREFNPSIDAFGENAISFTLENGASVLGSEFTDIQLHEYENVLKVTDVNDIVDYILSTTTMSGVDEIQVEGLDLFLEQWKDEDGVIVIPKPAGMFVAGK